MEKSDNLFTKKLFTLYSQLLFYENCPASMQTVSLVENIFSLSRDLWFITLSITPDTGMYDMAMDFVSSQLSLNFVRDSLLTEYSNGTNLLFLLKQYARSKAVKSYFDL